MTLGKGDRVVKLQRKDFDPAHEPTYGDPIGPGGEQHYLYEVVSTTYIAQDQVNVVLQVIA